MAHKPVATVAPWVRTRLRTAPGAACAVALLVLVTAFLAAALPRAVDVYETAGLRHAIDSAEPADRVVEVVTGDRYRPHEVLPDRLAQDHADILEQLPPSLRTLPADSAYGVRSTKRVEGMDTWLPKPYKTRPQLTLSSQSGIERHSTLRAGRFATKGAEPEAVVTVETAEALRIEPGAVVHVPGKNAQPVGIRITGIVEPSAPRSAYWSYEPTLRTPVYAAVPDAQGPEFYWEAALLLAPDAADTILRTTGGSDVYWRLAPASGHLTGRDVPELAAALNSLTRGPDLVRMRHMVGATTAVNSGLGDVVETFSGMRAAISPVVAVAAFGMGAVAAVVLAMTGGLFASRRYAELALLRSRGGSLSGIGVRLLGETTVTAVPAAALGLLLAVLAVDGSDSGAAGSARFLPALAAAGGVALVAVVALPLRALYLHRRPQLHGARDDLVDARPSRRRTVAELTLLVLAVGAVVALRRRGTGDAGDHLVSAAPVLVALIAALVLVRLYPLPLRWAARPAARLRGAVGYLSLARAGRSSANGALPLLALLVALTTTAFGGSVLAGVADARDRAAVLATGADARIASPVEWNPLPAGLERAVRGSAGVRDAVPVQIEYGVSLPSRVTGSVEAKNVTLVGVDPGRYARLARETDIGAFPESLLRSTGSREGGRDRVVPVIASPAVAERLGADPFGIVSVAGEFKVKVVAVRTHTPAVPDADFLLVNSADLNRAAPTALLVSARAGGLDGAALRGAVRAAGAKDFTVRLRQEQRTAYVDSPMQTGAERVYVTAIGAGAGYAGLAVLLSLVQSSPERATLLARLRTMGLNRRQGRRLLGLEALPQAVLAAAGGTLVGWATILLLAPGVDLVRLALAAAPGLTTLDHATLRADAWSLALPAAGVVLLTGAAAGLQAWWAARSGSIKELRAGDTR
ncbi:MULTISPECIES: ABC transporter permease [Streptomyces]|uniref:ABC transporter permease n=1 Tax=Streptomyces solicathayae TaxID=3081768 RepID=A0ABZ0LYC7_9ACTN|nr:ABC transporter permease [Streptomyces sp. HUAS YS2]WOX24320.1 ABC transporter permease [Streptomyces sp. HUAS YS2]